jgi:hypothetical protein
MADEREVRGLLVLAEAFEVLGGVVEFFGEFA